MKALLFAFRSFGRELRSGEVLVLLAAVGLAVAIPVIIVHNWLERSVETSSARILTHAADIDVGLRHEGRLIPLLTALMAAHGAVVLPRVILRVA